MRRQIRPILLGLILAASAIAVGIWANKGVVPTSVPTGPVELVINNDQIADAGLVLANQFTGQVRDSSSLQDLRAAIEERGRGGLAASEAELAGLQQLPKPPPLAVASLQFKISTLLMYEGRFDEATALIEKALAAGQSAETSSSNEGVIVKCCG